VASVFADEVRPRSPNGHEEDEGVRQQICWANHRLHVDEVRLRVRKRYAMDDGGRRGSHSDYQRLDMLPPDPAQHVRDLSHGRERFHRLEQRR
jgi:hypothetical protein